METFDEQLIALLPKMRLWALGMTRNRPAADDLVQDVATKALAARASFVPGSNFKAWIRRIMMNHFIAGMRGGREYTSMNELYDVAVDAEQPAKIDLERLSVEFEQLPDYLKDVLRQVAIEKRSYDEISAQSGCAVGTLKSRVSRARATLRVRIEGRQRSVAKQDQALHAL